MLGIPAHPSISFILNKLKDINRVHSTHTHLHNMSEQQTNVSTSDQTQRGSRQAASTAAPTSTQGGDPKQGGRGDNSAYSSKNPHPKQQLVYGSTRWSREITALGGPGGNAMIAKYGTDGVLSQSQWKVVNDRENAKDAADEEK